MLSKLVSCTARSRKGKGKGKGGGGEGRSSQRTRSGARPFPEQTCCVSLHSSNVVLINSSTEHPHGIACSAIAKRACVCVCVCARTCMCISDTRREQKR